MNIRPVVYCTAIAEGGQAEWDFLWKQYLETNVAAERIVILKSLGCSRNKAVLEVQQAILEIHLFSDFVTYIISLQNYLDLILTEAVRMQDKDDAFDATYLQRNENMPIVLDYVYTNFEKISRLWKGMSHVSNLVSGLAQLFTNELQVERLQSFYTANSLQLANSKAIPNAIISARYNIEWAQKHVPKIMVYLDNIQAGSASITVSITLIVASLLTYFY